MEDFEQNEDPNFSKFRGLFLCWKKLEGLHLNLYLIKPVLVYPDNANNVMTLLGLCFNTAQFGLGIRLTMLY